MAIMSPEPAFSRPSAAKIAGLLFGVIVLQMLFVTSYVSAFRDPQPHEIPVLVVGPAQQRTDAVDQIEDVVGDAIEPSEGESAQSARAALLERKAVAAIVLGTGGDELLIASGAGTSQAQAVTSVFQQMSHAQQRELTIADVAPLPDNDSHGVVPFYLVVVMTFGGYASVVVLVGLLGTAARGRREVVRRLGIVAAFAVVSATAATSVVSLGFGAADGHLLALWGVAALLSFATGSVALVLQALLGTFGTAAVIILFVIFGNPAAGGAVNYGLLPGPMRELGPHLVNGAGVDSMRSVIYLDGSGLGGPVLTLIVWAVVAVAVLAVQALRQQTTGQQIAQKTIARSSASAKGE